MKNENGARAIRTAVLAMFVAVPVIAAPHGPMGPGAHAGKFWRRPLVQAELKLTTEQIRDLDDIFSKNQKALIDLKADAEKRQLDLDALLADRGADENKLAAQVDLVEESRAKLGKARAAMMLDVRKVLTPDQREKLQQYRDRRQERGKDRMGTGHRGGRGGADGRGPGRNFR